MGWKDLLRRARRWPCAFLLTGPVAHATGPEVFDALWSRAVERRLWDDPEWWTLGHYHRTLWGLVRSRIDDPAFFVHPRGKSDRRAELEATLRAFVEPEAVREGERGVACRFPARRRWLVEKLEIPGEVFAVPDCAEYRHALGELGIARATVVYPAAYLNSPASMFGHLLLVLDREGKDRLLSRAVNYAAVVTDRFGPFFAFKGIFGLYDGVYAVLPYYDKVEEYSAVNRRDVWEYPLHIEGEALDRFLRHVWELQGLRSRYFFFKENCAFNLLYPIEVARPDLSMTQRFRTNAIPMALLRELTRTGVTGPPVYRPSKTTILAHLASLLDEGEQGRALALSRGAAPREDEDAVTLSLAIELAQYAYTEREVTPEAYRERVFPLLRERAKRGKVDLPEVPMPEAPENGHPAARVQVYGGSDREEGFAGLKARFAYHDPLDDSTGYPPGSFITFLEADARTRGRSGDVYLRELTFVDIRSLSPPRLWVTPLSWAVNFRMEADPFEVDHQRGFVRFGAGRAYEMAGTWLVYAMFDSALRIDSSLEEGIGWEPGGRAGLLRGGGRLRFGLEGSSHFGVLGSAEQRHQVDAELRVSLARGVDAGVGGSILREQDDCTREVRVSLGWLF